MKINKITQYLKSSATTLLNKKGDSLDSFKYDGFLQKLINDLKNTKDHHDAEKMLFDSAHANELEMFHGVRFKRGEFNIHVFFKENGKQYANALKKLNELKISAAPQHIESFEIGSDTFVVTGIKGIETGNLKPYWQEAKNIPNTTKLAIYQDMQKLTKAGYVDDFVLKSDEQWYCTPDKKIVLPSWMNFRKIRPDESQKDIMEKYYSTIFRN